MSYFDKYLKYKKKYLVLKGGAERKQGEALSEVERYFNTGKIEVLNEIKAKFPKFEEFIISGFPDKDPLIISDKMYEFWLEDADKINDFFTKAEESIRYRPNYSLKMKETDAILRDLESRDKAKRVPSQVVSKPRRRLRRSIKWRPPNYDPPPLDIIKSIIVLTMYVSFDEFLYALKINLEKFIDNIKNKPYILFNSRKENKSNYWISSIILNLLKETNYFFVNSLDRLLTLKQEGYKGDVLILDDAAYSGQQMYNYIQVIKSVIDTSTKIHLILPYMSEGARKRWTIDFDFYDVCNSSTCNKQVVVYNEIAVKKLPFNPFFELQKAELLRKYKDPIKYPFYFDHKIADHQSTYTILYEKIMYLTDPTLPTLAFYKHPNNSPNKKKLLNGTIWDNIGNGEECSQYKKNKYSNINLLKPPGEKPEC